MTAGISRLLLVEFAATDRFHRAVMFPFLHGLARSKNVDSRWLRFGMRAEEAMAEDGSGVELGDEDEGMLIELIGSFSPQLAVFSMRPGSRIAGRLARSFPGTRLCVLADEGEASFPPAAKRQLHSLTTARLAASLGFGPLPGSGGENLIEVSAPDFSFQPANQPAREMMPLPFLFLGEECSYNRSLRANPFFTGIELDACVRRGGCAFCTKPPARKWKTDPVELFRRQLDSVLETMPGRREPLELRLVGEPAVRGIEAICRELGSRELPALELLVDCRADTLLRSRSSLRRALRRLAGSSHRIEMCLMGVENFSSAELARMNKGLSPATNLRALRLLFELEKDFPACFGFRRFGGLSLITYTPWTRPADLALNLAVVDALEIEPLCGKLLSGRLRLYPSLPLYWAARRDGLLARGYRDGILDTSRRNMYRQEAPWRFAHPLLEAINRALVRLDDSRAGRRRLVGQALDVIDRKMDPAKGKRRAAATETSFLEAVSLLPFKPVVKLEPLSRRQIESISGSGALPNALARERGGGQERGTFELFAGNSAARVKEAAEISRRLDEAGGSEFRRLVRRMGGLLGYPACCSRAFSNENPRLMDDIFWLHIKRRLAEPGSVHPSMNPAANPVLEYVPCSLRCRKTTERSRILLKNWLKPKRADARTFARRMHNPYLIFRGAQSDCLELVPQDDPGERFRFRAGEIRGEGVLVRAAARGDELCVEPECLLVLRRGKEIAALSGRAFLWWHRRAFQADLWQALLQVLEILPPPGQAGAGADLAVSPPPALTPFGRRLQELMHRAGAERRGFGGLLLKKMEPLGPEKVRIELSRGDARLVLEIAPRRPGAPAFLQAGEYLLTYPLSHPIGTAAQLRAVKELARYLEES